MRRFLVLALVGGFGSACNNKPAEQPPAQEQAAPSMKLPPLPSGTIEGRLELAPALAEKVAAGDIIYLMARNAGTGGIVAVQKLAAPATFPLEFKLSGENVMMPGMSLAGQIKLSARVDKDGDAMSKLPGDVTGEVGEPVAVPAKDVVITLGTVL